MNFRDLKYLLAYSIPILCFFSLAQRGWTSWSTVVFVFIFIPLLEPIIGRDSKNLSQSRKAQKLKNRFFDWLLYLNLPIVYGTLCFFIYTLNTQALNNIEYTGLILSVGIILGSCGINVAHELGHRKLSIDRFFAKVLLLPSWYMHFIIEHNLGHHKHIATDEDPASARPGENLYAFWWRSVTQSYLHAWKLEGKRLKQQSLPFWSFRNEMIVFTLVQSGYFLGILLVSAYWYTALALVLAGIVGFLLLETINYIEHYGLRRRKLPSGRYERVRPQHSWNADYEIGRILLYELTRHSDHHFLASKKYQVLDHHEEAPELPFGYPTAMLTALLPPIWFSIMDRRLPQNETI